MVAPTLKSALNHYLQPTNLVEELRYRPLIRPSLSEADRAHLERWLKEVRDPVWGQLAAATRRHGKLPAFVEGGQAGRRGGHRATLHARIVQRQRRGVNRRSSAGLSRAVYVSAADRTGTSGTSNTSRR